MNKTITTRHLRRGTPEENLAPGESLLITKGPEKVYQLTRLDPRRKSRAEIIAGVHEEVPIPAGKQKFDSLAAVEELGL